MAPDSQAHIQQEQRTGLENFINKAKPYLVALVALVCIALGLSVWSFFLVQREDESWEKREDFEDSLKEEIKAFENKSEPEILLLTSEIKAFTISYLNNVSDVKSSVRLRIVKLNQGLIKVQEELSAVQSDIEGLGGNFTSVKDSVADEHTKVWAEFTKLTNEFNNLKSSVDKKMSRFIEDLKEVSGFKSDVRKLKAKMENVETSLEVEKTKVWAEFAELEKELKN